MILLTEEALTIPEYCISRSISCLAEIVSAERVIEFGDELSGKPIIPEEALAAA